MNKAALTGFIKTTAEDLGFSGCGIARAVRLNDDAVRLEKWLHSGMHGSMTYMENHFELRVDPTKLVPGAKSVITLLVNYYPSESQEKNIPRVSKYAWGKDYHNVIKEKLNLFLFMLREQVGEVNGRGFVDSAPVLERSWAERSGLGWIGKNGNLLNKKMGSFFFLATLITDLELDFDNPHNMDYCGTCTKCIDACPTEAILPGKLVNGSKCISYYTIELKDLCVPEEAKGKVDNWLFGCDVCQDVCPWNRFSVPHSEVNFTPIKEVLNFSLADWEELTEERFKIIFKNSPIKRAKYSGIKRNLKMLKSHE